MTASLGLPDECHIFQGQNRIVQYLTHRGVYVSGNTQWAVDGLDSADVVEIEYIAPGLSDDKQHILFTNGTKLRQRYSSTIRPTPSPYWLPSTVVTL